MKRSLFEKQLADLGISSNLLEGRRLGKFKEAKFVHLAEVGEDGREHYLIAQAVEAWQRMKKDAKKDGVNIFIVSAFRSVSKQFEIVRNKIEKGQQIDDIIKVSAPPGYSEHHTGCAVDVSTFGVQSLSEEFEMTTAFEWLNINAEKYRFSLSYPRGNQQGYMYEPWHWKYQTATD